MIKWSSTVTCLLVSDIIGFPTWLFLLLGRCEAAGRLLGMSEEGSRASTRRVYLQGSCRAFLAYEMLQPCCGSAA
jgi:hypothetical protein